MKFFVKTLSIFLLLCNLTYSQSKTITHKVLANETLEQIVKKYNTTAKEIYSLNPDAQKGIKPNSILIIPNNAKPNDAHKIVTPNKQTAVTSITHEVLPKETIYGIITKYGITEQDLNTANPFLAESGLQIGQKLTILAHKGTKVPEKKISQESPIYHVISPKETKFSISKQYGITVSDLEKLNPEIIENFPIGYKLLIKDPTVFKEKQSTVVTPITKEVKKSTEIVTKENPKTNVTPVATNKEVKKNTEVIAKEIPKPTTPTPSISKEIKKTTEGIAKNKTLIDYQIKPSETLYGLAKMFNISQEELISLNPVLKDSINLGMIIKVPHVKTPIVEVKKPYSFLIKNIAEGKRKRLAILLPFNLPNIENDSLNSTTTRLKKDKFLNITLDFYSGVLHAIDSAKVLGLPIDVEIYDSQENKNSSSVATLIQNNKLNNASAIIGPFYQSNAEVAALLLKEENVPVISPLSKDSGNSIKNLYQTVPSAETIKNRLFEYMRENHGKILAVVDPKKESTLKYINENQKGVSLVTVNAGGVVSSESFKSLLVKDKKNYVVMETANTMMIKSTIGLMLSAMNQYDVQLVVLEQNDALDGSEIKFEHLVKLKLMYPSLTRENASFEAYSFENKFKNENTVYPGAYATRGFDVTFDTMMRLSQEATFEETINSFATRQIDNQFEYYKKEDGGYTNKGVFILYYDSDLTIKEAR